MITVYGIRNCDTVKKALKWLEQEDVEYQFHDYKKLELEKKMLSAWCKQIDWELLLNRRGTTWRKLPDDARDNINKTSAIALMLEHTSMIKRPVIDTGNELLVGFDPERYQEIFARS